MANELREDLVSGDWIIFSPKRTARPHDLMHTRPRRVPAPKKSCAFDHLKKSGNWPPLFAFPNEHAWDLVVLPNKYPVVTHEGTCAASFMEGPYEVKDGIGFHELVVTRDHIKNFAHISHRHATKIFELAGERYRLYKKDPCVHYATTFFNWGSAVGASIYHPHYQLLGIPVVPPPVAHSLAGSEQYFKTHHRCVHCDMISFERKQKVRVILETPKMIALAPFASRSPYEVRIFPKTHNPYFETPRNDELAYASAMLQKILLRMERRLNDPDLNFFIHTAPLQDQKRYIHYHWHIEVLPRTTVFGGFEYGTGMNINVVLPEDAAKLLR